MANTRYTYETEPAVPRFEKERKKEKKKKEKKKKKKKGKGKGKGTWSVVLSFKISENRFSFPIFDDAT